MVEVRIAEKKDAAEILAIYAPYILHFATTFETELPVLQEFEERIAHYLEKYPWLVCVIDGSVVGYVYASSYKEREAYQWSCECSVYLQSKYQGMGIGKELYSVLFPILKLQGFRNLFAGITIPNEPSIKLHEGFGFSLIAVYENVGYKLGGWKSVGWWRLQLNDYHPEPAPPTAFSTMNYAAFENNFKSAAEKIASKIIH